MRRKLHCDSGPPYPAEALLERTGSRMAVPFLDELLKQSAEFERGLAALAADRPAWIEGLAGSAKTAVAASCARSLGRVALIITPDEETSERACEDLAVFGFAPERVGL